MASSSSSAPPSANCSHDVFLSFRGDDVRVRFRSHFLKELERKSITPFKDDEMERGQSIAPELVNAIRGSRISIVAFSDNYADSSWCLDELVEITKCRKDLNQIVIPIFYGVDPSHVEQQTEAFGKIFEATCKDRTEEVKLEWKQALTETATIAGEDSRNWKEEAKMIEKIVNDVSNKLNSTTSNDFDDFVGIEDHMKKINRLLPLEPDEVIMVGIWGPSGVGKTTIGRALFSQLSCQFTFSLFVDKTMEMYTRANSYDHNTKLYLQTQFLSEILDQKDIKIHNLRAVKERLGCKRVLLVFDDLNDKFLLDALVGSTKWFGPGSRIVVITKDRSLLRSRRIKSENTYKMDVPSEDLALKMFCRCAFGQDSPPDGFKEFAVEAVKLTENLPLCINVLGSSLANIKEEDWANTVHKLRDTMADHIKKTLRDSYDMLKDNDKAIFRHIACLFNHKPCDYVTRLLEDSKLGVADGLKTLADRCLIQISEDKIIRMHEFLQEMGRDIVRQQCIQEPAEREFLMDSKEIRNVLVDRTGSKSVSGIFLNLSDTEGTLSISEEAFMRMKKLKFLSIYGVLPKDKEDMLHLQGKNQMWSRLRLLECLGMSLRCLPVNFPGGGDYIWDQLRLLEWWGCSLKCLPSNFQAEYLVELRMPESHLEILWEGVQPLRSLKKIDLQGSKRLKEIPDLSEATSLEEMYLGDCWSLVKIPDTMRNLHRLTKLDMKRCKNLQGVPTDIDLESLHSLNLSGCSQLKSFPEISRNITYLFLDETEIEQVPSSIEAMSRLSYILMNGCSNLNYISPEISRLRQLEVIFFSTSWHDSPSAVETTTHNVPSRLWKYDVFLSFPVTDVRKTLVSHLQMELSRKLITTFMDKDTRRGVHLATAIKRSRVAIVVISESYMSSQWCLDELVEIIECHEETGQRVIPIYYGVSPSQCKDQIPLLGKTFGKTCDEEMQQRWVRALKMLINLLGFFIGRMGSESDMIQRIAAQISVSLNDDAPKGFGIEKLPSIGNSLDQEAEKIIVERYDGLNGNEKALFRHIACFLNNEKYTNVMQLLEDCGFDVGVTLSMLKDKGLIKISYDRVISMHHELQKIGRRIVCGPFVNQPAKPQFLMDTNDGCDVLIDYTGCENVIGISFKVSEIKETSKRDDSFKGLKKLQFMRMYKEKLVQGKEVRFHLVKGLHSMRHHLSSIT